MFALLSFYCIVLRVQIVVARTTGKDTFLADLATPRTWPLALWRKMPYYSSGLLLTAGQNPKVEASLSRSSNPGPATASSKVNVHANLVFLPLHVVLGPMRAQGEAQSGWRYRCCQLEFAMTAEHPLSDAKTEQERRVLREELQLRKLVAEIESQELDLSRKMAQAAAHRVYTFYGAVNSASVSSCLAELGIWSRESPQAPLTVVFNSPGGFLDDGLALYDYLLHLRSLGHHLTTVALGQAASMCGVLLQAGDVRVMGPSAPLSSKSARAYCSSRGRMIVRMPFRSRVKIHQRRRQHHVSQSQSRSEASIPRGSSLYPNSLFAAVVKCDRSAFSNFLRNSASTVTCRSRRSMAAGASFSKAHALNDFCCAR